MAIAFQAWTARHWARENDLHSGLGDRSSRGNSKRQENMTFKDMTFKDLCRKRWQNGTFFQQGVKTERTANDQFPWIEYESYMQAKVIKGIPGQIGILLVKFPSSVSEDNDHHTHPCSDRRVTVLKGSGTFEYFKKNQLLCIELSKGDRVWMPRGILHTFRSGTNGLLVESLHNPFVPFDDPKCLVYPKE